MKRLSPQIVALVVLVCCVALRGQTSAQKKPAKPPKFEMTPDEKAILELTNKEREKEKLPALKPNARLFQAARAHSQNMANQDWMLHELDGKGPGERIGAAGYRHHGYSENIAYGIRDLEKIMKMWMDSEVHRANILDKRRQEIGIGIAYNERDRPYYTQVFATPKR